MRAALFLLVAACGDDFELPPSGTVDPGRTDTILALSGDATTGEAVFDDHCAACHDPAGAEARVGPALAPWTEANTRAATLDVVLSGQGAMPAQNVDDQDAADLLAWMYETWGGGGPTAPDGADLYVKNCRVCHPVDGTAGVGPGMATVVPASSTTELTDTVTNGKGGGMPPFKDALDADEIDAIVAWLQATFPT